MSRAARARWQLARMVLDRDRIGELRLRPALLQQELADALGDPSLRVTYPLGGGRYVDVDGRPAPPPAVGAGRSVTSVGVSNDVVAVIEHDEVLAEQHRLAMTVADVAGAAIENARMHATLRAQMEQLRLAGVRVSTAAYDERRRIQRDLHDGAQQQFLAVLVLLDVARNHLDTAAAGDTTVRAIMDRAHTQLRQAIGTLRELSQGIYPATLTEHGLAAAVQSIADISPIAVELDADGRRWPHEVETTAYFLVAEAIANAYKHADATHLTVQVVERGDRLHVTVTDDGRGGATSQAGTGLSGMHDRVTAIGGTLAVASRPSGGTTVTAQLPLELP
jgi:signal transduction histidine kinase